MKLWVDDIRGAPDGTWTIARTISQAVSLMSKYSPEVISLDHDISFQVHIEGVSRPYPSPETFRPVAHFIGEQYRGFVNSPKLFTHSANPDGRKEIIRILNDYGLECTENPYPPATRQ